MPSLDNLLDWLGLIVWLGLTAVIVHSLWRTRRRPRVRAAGHVPTALRSPWLLGALLAAYAVVLVMLWRPIFPAASATARAATSIIGTLLLIAGAGIILWGRFALGELHNISSVAGAELFADHHLVTVGPYALVRHPMYLGFAVAIAGTLILYGTWSLVFVALHGLVFVARARREEQALATTFGEEWEAYRRRVPAIFPRLSRR